MKIKFSNKWKSSKQKRKQVKYVKNAPLHVKNKLVSIHLSKDLRAKYASRNITAKKGDKVKVLRGSQKGKSGKISRVDTRNMLIFIEGIETTKIDGSKTQIGINPSNLMLTEVSLDDKKRQKTLERKKDKKETKESKK